MIIKKIITWDDFVQSGYSLPLLVKALNFYPEDNRFILYLKEKLSNIYSGSYVLVKEEKSLNSFLVLSQDAVNHIDGLKKEIRKITDFFSSINTPIRLTFLRGGSIYITFIQVELNNGNESWNITYWGRNTPTNQEKITLEDVMQSISYQRKEVS